MAWVTCGCSPPSLIKHLVAEQVPLIAWFIRYAGSHVIILPLALPSPFLFLLAVVILILLWLMFGLVGIMCRAV